MPTQWTFETLDQLFTDLGSLAPLEGYASARLKALKPTDQHLSDATSRANRLGRMLCGKSGLGGVGHCIIGSLAKSTANHPVKDIDLVVLFDEQDWLTRGTRYKPATVIGELTSRLSKTYAPRIAAGHVNVVPQDHSVGLEFINESRVNVDVVPAFVVNSKQKILEIPERSTKEWVQTSPENQLITLRRLSQRRHALRGAIRLLKLWRINTRALPLSSFALEILAQIVVNHRAPQTPMAIVEAVLKLIVATELTVPMSLVKQPTPSAPIVIMDTGVQGNNVTGHLTQHDRALTVRLAAERLTALQKAATLVEAGKERGTKTRLRPFFGHES